ncbi:hypothetical protein TNCV_1750991 [Trichonephila clavipes]|nr:hypothetical protein TNCV_1750991 [Trichonephila clavipes]
MFNFPEAENRIKSVHQIRHLVVMRPKTTYNASIKSVFKIHKNGAIYVQYAVQRCLKQVEIEKQHVPQLIEVSPRSRSECVTPCVTSIQISVQ